ncbi:hypothetical protein SEA_SCENTAE_218 [Gordonia phage SCentae]|nr:hypothetical protein SEA_SCENTAE_218 [Gordonia phage SCentae]
MADDDDTDEHPSPVFINEQGVKWWNLLIKGGVSVWRCKFPDGSQSYCVMQGDEVVYESTKIEEVGLRADVLSLMEAEL